MSLSLQAGGRKGENLADRIYQHLKRGIFDFRRLPGDRFSENGIAERMGGSRTPVREALFRLERVASEVVLHRSCCQLNPLDFTYFQELFYDRTGLACAAVRPLREHSAPDRKTVG